LYQTEQNPSIPASINLQFCKIPRGLTESIYIYIPSKYSLFTGYKLRLPEVWYDHLAIAEETWVSLGSFTPKIWIHMQRLEDQLMERIRQSRRVMRKETSEEKKKSTN